MRPKLLLFIGGIPIWAQQNAFGPRLGLSFYQYRTPYAQFYARVGGEVGALGNIGVYRGRKLYYNFLPGFGYLLSHSLLLLDSSIYISAISGRPLPSTAKAHTYTHYLYLQGIWAVSFEKEGIFVVGVGPQVLFLLGQSLMLEYETVDGQPIQEWNTVSLSEVMEVTPRWIANLSLYAHLRIREGRRWNGYLYLQTIHQIKSYLWPTGLLLGISWLWKAQEGE
ncbi:MAG: hypothetical protein RMJ66_07235 [Bacteroidia bacterium]|nr:hypothetical protein [Bacteroidia bacterium]MDW8134847.1 hypothetical protein [Bacteroidia bacterium]